MGETVRFRARIRLFRSDEGGRERAASSGYRPQVKVGHLYTSGMIEPIDRDIINPGDECVVKITILEGDYFEGLIKKGQAFDLAEGARKVGEGKILGVLEDKKNSLDTTPDN